ncbi:hypothetical protein [Actinobaculum sp. 352]|uniref:hypothetical protein n=1 Tax=Actinobaculum sp. 352 TaxID=2490946 RepID=UPI000F7DB108|nr:hypothetical protein [Actinobaculum sp. 352]RTE49620.1 hypothetical protein EKN07_06135 [Actinobaculum sp. 352]
MTTTATATATVREEAETLMRTYLALDEQAQAIEEQKASIKTRLADLYPQGCPDIAGKRLVVTTPRRIAWDKVAKDFPASTHPELYEQAFNQRAAKRLFSEAALDAYRMPGKVTVTVR